MWVAIFLSIYFCVTAIFYRRDEQHSGRLFIIAHMWLAAAAVIGSLK